MLRYYNTIIATYYKREIKIYHREKKLTDQKFAKKEIKPEKDATVKYGEMR